MVRRRGKKHSKGAALVEYALLVALIAIICISAVRSIGETTNYTIRAARRCLMYRSATWCDGTVRR
jgi:Flp pilus assembly pilin Flp